MKVIAFAVLFGIVNSAAAQVRILPIPATPFPVYSGIHGLPANYGAIADRKIQELNAARQKREELVEAAKKELKKALAERIKEATAKGDAAATSDIREQGEQFESAEEAPSHRLLERDVARYISSRKSANDKLSRGFEEAITALRVLQTQVEFGSTGSKEVASTKSTLEGDYQSFKEREKVLTAVAKAEPAKAEPAKPAAAKQVVEQRPPADNKQDELKISDVVRDLLVLQTQDKLTPLQRDIAVRKSLDAAKKLQGRELAAECVVQDIVHSADAPNAAGFARLDKNASLDGVSVVVFVGRNRSGGMGQNLLPLDEKLSGATKGAGLTIHGKIAEVKAGRSANSGDEISVRFDTHADKRDGAVTILLEQVSCERSAAEKK